MNGIRAKGGNCHLPWEEVGEFEEGEFMGFVAISNKMVENPDRFGKGIENEEYVINTFGENTEAWKEATQKAHEMRGELRVQF